MQIVLGGAVIKLVGTAFGQFLLAVDREPFLTAVTGHGTTRERASSIASAHLDPPTRPG